MVREGPCMQMYGHGWKGDGDNFVISNNSIAPFTQTIVNNMLNGLSVACLFKRE